MTTERTDDAGITRRHLLTTAGCLAASALLPGRSRAAIPEAQPWGAIVPLADGVWAVASTPLKERNFATLCNGGIVAGRERVLVIEAFASADGARWVANAARELTGRQPTDIVVTHYHGDHTNGLAGLLAGDAGNAAPTLHGTATTLERIDGDENGKVKLVDEARAVPLDVGGRSVLIHPHRGHTASDLTLELPEDGILFGGDLLWNRMIPNYVDARPLELKATLRALEARQPKTVVPGHGPLGNGTVVARNIALTGAIEAAARSSHADGVTAADAVERIELDAELAAWTAFSPTYLQTAIAAWHRALGAGSGNAE